MADLPKDQKLTQSPTPNIPASDQPSVEEPQEEAPSPPREDVKAKLSSLGIKPSEPKKPPKKGKIVLAVLSLLLILASIPAAVYLVKQRQEIRKEAAGCPAKSHFRVVGEVYCQDPGGPKIPIPGVKIRRILKDCSGPENCVLDERVKRFKICNSPRATYAGTGNRGRWASDARIVDPTQYIPEGMVRVWAFKIAEMPPKYKDANGVERDTSRLVGPIAENCEQSNVCVTPSGFSNTTFCGGGKKFYQQCSFDPTAGGKAQKHGHNCYLFDNSDRECSPAQSTGKAGLDRLYSKDPCTGGEPGSRPNCYWPFLGTQESDTPPLNFKFTNCTPETAPPLCINLEGEPDPSSLEPNEEIALTCTGSGGLTTPVDHFEFRVGIDEETSTDLGSVPATKTDGEYQAQKNYTIPSYGCYKVECRACASSDSSECTEWGQADGVVPL